MIYYVTVFSHYGGERHYETHRDINQVIAEHEDMWDYLVVEDAKGRELYRSYGLDEFLKKHRI